MVCLLRKPTFNSFVPNRKDVLPRYHAPLSAPESAMDASASVSLLDSRKSCASVHIKDYRLSLNVVKYSLSLRLLT